MNYFSLEQIQFVKNEFEKVISNYEISRFKINELEEVLLLDDSLAFIMSYFVNTKKSTGLRCISYTACLYSSSLRWKDSYISSGTL